MEDILVPLIVFTAVAFCFWCIYYFKNQEKEKIQDTICKAIDAGQQLNPETIKALGVKSVSTPFTDLRKSVLLVALGLAIRCGFRGKSGSNHWFHPVLQITPVCRALYGGELQAACQAA